MARAKAILQSQFPYNVTARCINREWFNIPMGDVWAIFCHELQQTKDKFGWNIHVFVLMSNHFHLIVSTPDSNISQCMHRFMTSVSRRLNWRGNRINETFAGRHYKCVLHEPNYYLNAYKYNYRNPVRAGICRDVEDYPFSSLRFQLGDKDSAFAIEEDTTFLSDPPGTRAWLNTAPTKEKNRAVKIALRRPYFKSGLGKNRKPALGLNDRL